MLNVVWKGENKQFEDYELRQDGNLYNLLTDKKIKLINERFSIRDHYSFLKRSLIWWNLKKYINFKNKIESTYKPVFGKEDEFCINWNVSDKFKVWSKKLNRFMKLFDCDQYNHQKTAGNMFIHRAVWETYHQQKIPKGFMAHHLSHDAHQNNPQNIIILPANVHRAFENYYRAYKGGDNFAKFPITKEVMIERINNFDIPQIDKYKLIENL